MTTTPSSPAASRTEGQNAVKAWRRDAALCLGANDAVARHFGETGLIELDGKPLSLQPLSDKPWGPWIASARASQPADVGEARWCEALLLASGQSLLAMHAAFGLSEDGDAVLISRILPGPNDPALLAAEVVGLLALRRALIEGVRSELAAEDVAQDLEPEEPRPAAVGAPPGDDPTAQEFEAPEDVLVMVHGAMLHLGRTAEQALAAARSGSLEINGQSIGLACDADGENLVVAAELSAGVLDTAAQRRAALLANTELMAFVGMAVVRDRRQARLMSRWHLPGQSAENFAGWLSDFARLAAAIVERHAAAANH